MTRLFLIIMALLAITAPFLPAEGASVIVQGDRDAWQEINAAWQRLYGLRTYRAKAQMPRRGEMLLEVERRERSADVPRMRIVMQGKDTKIETVRIGDQVWQRVQSGRRSFCQAGAATIGLPSIDDHSPARIAGEVLVTRVGRATVSGVDTQSYEYAAKDAATGKFGGPVRIYVDAQGLPRRMDAWDRAWKGKVTWDYYDFNAAFRISPPSAC